MFLKRQILCIIFFRSCWNATPGGEIQVEQCPNFPDLAFHQVSEYMKQADCPQQFFSKTWKDFLIQTIVNRIRWRAKLALKMPPGGFTQTAIGWRHSSYLYFFTFYILISTLCTNFLTFYISNFEITFFRPKTEDGTWWIHPESNIAIGFSYSERNQLYDSGVWRWYLSISKPNKWYPSILWSDCLSQSCFLQSTIVCVWVLYCQFIQ